MDVDLTRASLWSEDYYQQIREWLEGFNPELAKQVKEWRDLSLIHI